MPSRYQHLPMTVAQRWEACEEVVVARGDGRFCDRWTCPACGWGTPHPAQPRRCPACGGGAFAENPHKEDPTMAQVYPCPGDCGSKVADPTRYCKACAKFHGCAGPPGLMRPDPPKREAPPAASKRPADLRCRTCGTPVKGKSRAGLCRTCAIRAACAAKRGARSPKPKGPAPARPAAPDPPRRAAVPEPVAAERLPAPLVGQDDADVRTVALEAATAIVHGFPEGARCDARLRLQPGRLSLKVDLTTRPPESERS